MEIELEQLKGSVMSLVMAANSSAEGDTYRELSDAVLQVKDLATHERTPCAHSVCMTVCGRPHACMWPPRSSCCIVLRRCVTLHTGRCLVPVQLINWMLALADGNASGGAPGQGFKAAGFESFERIWTGQQVRMCWLLTPACC